MPPPSKNILLIGASRGLGYAMAAEYLKHGWNIVATVRGRAMALLHDLSDKSGNRIEIETVDICEPDQIASLRTRLSGRIFDVLFVNAGVTNDPRETIADVTTEEFVRVMVTNALSPMRVIEALHDRVSPTGTIGVMSSGQSSVSNNTTGMREVYRGSKAALNTLMRSFAARHSKDSRAMVLMAPGWVRTDMGGPDASLDVETSIRGVVDVISAAKPGLHYVNYQGKTVRW
jgi:NAD(P)-dependent dehydrogenase (short-subunit alcohol dehydrogenase family)